MTSSPRRSARRQADEVQERLHRLMSVLRSRLQRELRGDGLDGLAPMELRVLMQVARHPGVTQATLVEHSGRDKAQMARLLAGLESRGLLQRAPDAQDGRRWCLTPTDEGRRLAGELDARRRRSIEAMLDGFSEEELGALDGFLARMQANLDGEAS